MSDSTVEPTEWVGACRVGMALDRNLRALELVWPDRTRFSRAVVRE